MLALLVIATVHVFVVVILKLVSLAVDEGALMGSRVPSASFLVLVVFLDFKRRERISLNWLLNRIETALANLPKQASLLKSKHRRLVMIAHAVGVEEKRIVWVGREVHDLRHLYLSDFVFQPFDLIKQCQIANLQKLRLLLVVDVRFGFWQPIEQLFEHKVLLIVPLLYKLALD